MVESIRYVERVLMQSSGQNIEDLENMNYWELLKILDAQDPSKHHKLTRKHKDSFNPFDFFKSHV